MDKTICLYRKGHLFSESSPVIGCCRAWEIDLLLASAWIDHREGIIGEVAVPTLQKFWQIRALDTTARWYFRLVCWVWQSKDVGRLSLSFTANSSHRQGCLKPRSWLMFYSRIKAHKGEYGCSISSYVTTSLHFCPIWNMDYRILQVSGPAWKDQSVTALKGNPEQGSQVSPATMEHQCQWQGQ